MSTDILAAPGMGTYRTVNPATAEIVRTFPALTDDEAEILLAQAHDAHQGWRATPIPERVLLFRRFAKVIEENTGPLARLVTEEMGKPLAQAEYEASIVCDMFRYYAEQGAELLSDQEVQIPGFSRGVTRREPLGVVLGIEPWNGPLYQAMRVASPNLMLGNTVLLKPSELCPSSTSFFDGLFAEAGFPAHVYQTALVSADQVSNYIADARLRAVTLTGSDRAGAAIGEQAGRNIKPVVLELGGADAFIVLDSADVGKAADTAATCRLANAGQICISPKRLILTEAVADAFIARFVALFDAQVVGDPLASETTVGPLASAAAADLLGSQYQDALDKGATVLVAGGRMDGPGAYFRPAVITDVTPDMRVVTEEVFGPLAVIYRVPDATAAVALANDSPYGLGATVFAEEMGEALNAASLLDTGGVGINNWLGAPIEIPFGGTKRSGFGRELGPSGMDPFANIKTYGIA